MEVKIAENKSSITNSAITYHLVGITNFLGDDLYPEFVTAVFKSNKDDELYMQIADESKSLDITEFYPLSKRLLDENRIIFFNSNIKTNDISYLLKDNFSVGSSVVYAYQVNQNEYLIERYPNFRELLLKHNFDDEVFKNWTINKDDLRKEIEQFIADTDIVANL